MNLMFREFQTADYDAVRDLYYRVWGASRDPDYDRMRFLDGFMRRPTSTVAVADGILVGYFTLWPMELTEGKIVVVGGQAMDVMTDPGFRGKGIFSNLAKLACHAAARDGMKLLFGVPNAEIYPTYRRRLSWATPSTVDTYIRPLLIDKALFSMRNRSILENQRLGDYDLQFARPKADLLKQLWSASRTAGSWGVQRSVNWVDFRYQNVESVEYRWCSVFRKNELRAVAVYRYFSSGSKTTRVNLMSLEGLSHPDLRMAIRAANAAASSAGARYVVATVASKRRARYLSTNGFVKIRSVPLIAKTLDAESYLANPFERDGWDLLGADFDFN